MVLVPIGAWWAESDVEASGAVALALPVRVGVGIGSLEAPNGPEKGGLPPLETGGIDLEER